MSIEGIVLENFSVLQQIEINASTKSCLRHAMFLSFLSDDRKQDASTTNANRKLLIELLKLIKVLTSALSKIWGNTDGCAEQYICVSALYLMSVMSQCYSVIVDSGISAPVHDKEVDNGLNAIDKCYIYPLMYNVQLPRSKIFDSHILMYYCTQDNDFSMDKKSQKDMSKEHHK